MKKTLLNIALFGAIAFNITGCARYIDRSIQVPSESDAKKNNATKLYYEDTNNDVIRDNIKNIVNHSNEKEMIPEYIYSSKSSEEVEELWDFKFDYKLNSEKRALDFKVKIDENPNYILIDKKYSSRNEAYLDFLRFCNFINYSTLNHPELKDKFGSNYGYYYIDKTALNNGQLRFTTKREKARAALSSSILKAYSNSGYQFVTDIKDADKIVYFQFTRDYFKNEIKQLEKEGKGITPEIAQYGMSNQVNVMQSSMSVAGKNNSSASSVGIGLGAGLIVGLLTYDPNPNFIFPTFKMIDVKENKSYLMSGIALSGISIYNSASREEAFRSEETNSIYYQLRKINEGDGKNYLTPLN